MVSAKTDQSLARYINILKRFLIDTPSVNLADMAYTLQVGRKHFEHRISAAFKDREELIQLLDSLLLKGGYRRSKERGNSLVFMFPGQGSQYVDMAKDLYVNNPVFSEVMDRGFAIIKKLTGEDFKDVLYPAEKHKNIINETRYAQPLIFLLEYSIAQLIMSYGIVPGYVIGHSIGEYVAACISGVFSFEDGLKLVVKRGELMNKLPYGSMIGLSLNEEQVKTCLNEYISLAAVNGPEQTVLSGDSESIEQVIQEMRLSNIPCVKLHTSHAFHSSMMDPILPFFKKELDKVEFKNPKYTLISNLTGNPIAQNEAISSDYWLMHLRETVKFTHGINTLFSQKDELVFIEVGAGHSLTNLLKQQELQKLNTTPVNLIRSAGETQNDEKYFTEKLGQLWSQGVDIKWDNHYKSEKRQRISLPTYSFDPFKFIAEVNALEALSTRSLKINSDMKDCFYCIQWRQSFWVPGKVVNEKNQFILIFCDEFDLSEKVIRDLDSSNISYCLVKLSQRYQRINDLLYTINPEEEQGFEHLFYDLNSRKIAPSHIYHFWNFDGNKPGHIADGKTLGLYQKLGYESLLTIIRRFSTYFSNSKMQLSVIGNGWYNVFGNELICPEKSTSLASVKVVPLEFENISCRAIDVVDTSNESVIALLKELRSTHFSNETAIRGRNKYVKNFDKIEFEAPSGYTGFKKNGTYLITGANGGMANFFSIFLADEFQSNLILIGRKEAAPELIETLERRGAKVIYVRADVTDSHKMTEGILHAEAVFGEINGVIHAAGTGDFAGIILRRTIEDDKKILAPKVTGTEVLISLFKNKKLDFFVNCSSMSASLAKFSQVAYVAGNIYQDTVAEFGNSAFPIISIEWPALKEVGMAMNSIGHLNSKDKKNLLKYGITPSEAIKVLSYALFLKLPVPIISIIDFREYFQNYYADEENGAMDNIELLSGYTKFRPNLTTDYVPPRTELEKKLASMLGHLLGNKDVGLEDNFFELGGDSLKAMIFLKRINKEFNISISLKDFLEMGTLIKIAAKTADIIRIKTDVSRGNKIII
jgi:acyl transferase domain-containing protein/acyl carrier protein